MKRLVAVGIFFATLGMLYVTSVWWLPLPAELLVVNDQIRPADAIFVLAGDSLSRPKLAAKLFEQGIAPKIITSGSDYYQHLYLALGERLIDAEVNKRILVNLGVPEDAIIVFPTGTGTLNEANALKQYIQKHPMRSFVLVTSYFHSRRLKWIFTKILNDEDISLMVVEADNGKFNTRNWWKTEGGLVTLLNEYIKLAYYYVKY